MQKKTLAAMLAGTTLLVTACDSTDMAAMQGGEKPPAAVVTDLVKADQVEFSGSYIGRLEAINQVELVPRVQGYLEEILVEDGQNVSEGQLLFVIEKTNYIAQAQAAAANLAQGKAQLDKAITDLDRAKQLFARGNTSEAKRDEAVAAQRSAQANVISLEAALRQAELNLSYTEIRAPFSGRIGKITPSIGDLLTSGSGTIASLVKLSPIYANFSISERDYYQYVTDDKTENQAVTRSNPLDIPVKLELPNGEAYGQTGKITFIDNQFHSETASLAIRAEFDNPQSTLMPGGYVQVHPFSAEPQDVILVPQPAVQRDLKGPFVLVVDDADKVQQRYITVSEQYDTSWIVTSGLTVGEQIIVQGVQKARSGATVAPTLASDTQ